VDDSSKNIIWSQFGAAIDALGLAIDMCPESLWGDRTKQPEFWYTTYHALFWLDLYLSESLETFQPPEPFNLDELDPAGILPARVYTQAELRDYLAHGRAKCRQVIAALTPERAHAQCGFEWVDMSVGELLLYNLRHVQHHAAQLNLLLRHATGAAPHWVFRAHS